MTKDLWIDWGSVSTVDITENPDEMQKLIDMGYRAAPVVMTADVNLGQASNQKKLMH